MIKVMKQTIQNLAEQYPCHLRKVVENRHPDLYAIVNAYDGETFAQKAYNYVHDTDPSKHSCETCGVVVGFVKFPIGYRRFCTSKCMMQHTKRAVTIPQQLQKLKSMGIELLSEPSVADWSNKKKYTFKNAECGHTFDANFCNVINGKTMCSVCGPTKRIAAASRAYMEKFGRTDWDMAKYKDYRLLVNKLTRRTYIKNRYIINPDGLKIGRAGVLDAHHIDHIVPVIHCYLNDVAPEVCASLENIQLLPWLDNLSKHDELTDQASLILAGWTKTGLHSEFL
jgi:hypothetical protein